jgi:NADPH-dependent 2,4-dienoyl-CoA reductase/sulfur reductase-like enzyme
VSAVSDEISFDGRPVPVAAGQTVAAALWDAGIRSWRRTRTTGAPRGLFCGIGACFDCLATIDGRLDQRACLVAARAGMVVGTGSGLGAEHETERGPTAAGRHDLAVVGAGPAGLAAAATAALAGARVALVDAGPRPGGQFWRHRDGERGGRGHRDWRVFDGLCSIVEERVDYVPGAPVWFVEPGFVLHTSAGRISAPRIVLATGAYDRVVPFPGWDLPGVVTPGAAQALLKGSGVPAGREVVVAGAGPFLLPVAAGLVQAGVRVVGVFEAGDPRAYLRRASSVAGVPGRLGEAAAYAATLARGRVPYRTRHAVVAAHAAATGELSGVDIARLSGDGEVDGSPQRLACDTVAVGYGFTANLELALALGCVTRRSTDGGLALMVDAEQQTSVLGVYAAGEVTGIGGAPLAVLEGEIAGNAAARAGGFPAPLSRRDLAMLRRRRRRLTAFADAVHAAHAVPAGWPGWLAADTMVCRCEEVPYQRIVAAVTDLGATDARSVKLLARPGMGWCQGRVCGYAVAHLTARACGRDVSSDDLAALARRPLAAPVRLGDLAAG